MQCAYLYIDRVLVSAFIKRWLSITNTFHIPFGEMTITLDDVSCLIGLPVIILHVSLGGQIEERPYELVARAFALSKTTAQQSLAKSDDSTVTLEWLQSTFSYLHDVNNDLTIMAVAGAYLLYLLGCPIFSNKTGTMVSIQYLHLLIDLDQFGLMHGMRRHCVFYTGSWVLLLEPIQRNVWVYYLAQVLDFLALPL